MIKLLENITRTNIAYATHQFVRLFGDPRAPHGTEVENLVKYLAATKNDGLILDSKKLQSLEIYTDSYFLKNWHNTMAPKEVSTTKLHTGYASAYMDCLIIWDINLQTHIALTTTKAKYMCLIR